MNREEKFRALIAKLSSKTFVPVRTILNWENRIIKINGFDVGFMLRNETHWCYLSQLAIRKPRRPGLSNPDDAVVDNKAIIRGRAKAGNCRREIGRILGPGITRLFIASVRGVGTRLQYDVKVPQSAEAGLQYYANPEDRKAKKSKPLDEDNDPQDGEWESGNDS